MCSLLLTNTLSTCANFHGLQCWVYFSRMQRPTHHLYLHFFGHVCFHGYTNLRFIFIIKLCLETNYLLDRLRWSRSLVFRSLSRSILLCLRSLSLFICCQLLSFSSRSCSFLRFMDDRK